MTMGTVPYMMFFITYNIKYMSDNLDLTFIYKDEKINKVRDSLKFICHYNRNLVPIHNKVREKKNDCRTISLINKPISLPGDISEMKKYDKIHPLIQLKMIQLDWGYIQYIKNPTEAIMKLVVLYDPFALFYLPKQSEAVQLLAIYHSERAMEHIYCPIRDLKECARLLHDRTFRPAYVDAIQVVLKHFPEYVHKIKKLPGAYQMLISPETGMEGGKVDSDINFKYIKHYVPVPKYIW